MHSVFPNGGVSEPQNPAVQKHRASCGILLFRKTHILGQTIAASRSSTSGTSKAKGDRKAAGMHQSRGGIMEVPQAQFGGIYDAAGFLAISAHQVRRALDTLAD